MSSAVQVAAVDQPAVPRSWWPVAVAALVQSLRTKMRLIAVEVAVGQPWHQKVRVARVDFGPVYQKIPGSMLQL